MKSLKCYFPQNVMCQFQTGVARKDKVTQTDYCSRLISRPDVSTSSELAAVTSLNYCLIFKFQRTHPANKRVFPSIQIQSKNRKIQF